MIEIKPGPELDRAVAEAIGWTPPRIPKKQHPTPLPPCPPFSDYFHPPIEVEQWRSNYHWRRPRGECHKEPDHFSTDLNATFAAAEKVGLFTRDGMRFLRRDIDGAWIVETIVAITPDESALEGVHASTPALAICAAILKLKNKHD